jgi:ribosomal protein L37E
MKTHVRCRGCGRRKYLPKSPGEYLVQPECATCGERNWRRDAWKNHPANKQVCDQPCRHFPHRRGSAKCYYNADGTDKPADQLYQELYGELDEQESGSPGSH